MRNPGWGGRLIALSAVFALSTYSLANDPYFNAAAANNAFAWDALSVLQEGAPDENLVVSPFSIHQVMSMTYGAARTRTEAELKQVLHLSAQALTHPAMAGLAEEVLTAAADDRTRIGMANRLWLQESWPIEAGYKELLTDTYETTLEQADFASASPEQLEVLRETVNDWVAEETFNLITELLPNGAFNNLTRWVLVNALAFKAPFENPFSPDVTRDATFQVSESESLTVRMMHQDTVVASGSNAWVDGIALDLAGGSFSLIILLPREGVSLEEVVDALRAGSFSLDGSFFSSPKRHFVYLPRFEVRKKQVLNDTFKALGAEAPFDPSLSDFSGMTAAPDAYIQRIDHEAFLTVVEGGIEAAAATSVTGGVTSIPPVFRADRPFLFAVREDTTGTILFAGQVHRPENPADVAPDWRARAEEALGGKLSPAGEGWYDSPIGSIVPDQFPWLYHRDLGWIYLSGEGGKVWSYHMAGLGWIWTDLNRLYPVIYLHEWDHPWGYLMKDESGNPVIWHYESESYHPVP